MTTAAEKARMAQNAAEVQRQLDLIRRLGSAAYLRSPGAWQGELDAAAGRVSTASDPRRAAQLVEAGNKLIASGSEQGLDRIVRDLWQLMPHDPEDAALAHGSGVR